MVQTTSARGRQDLIHSEGSRLTAYLDSVGVWTIGVGHAATSGRPPIPKKGMKITKAEEERILAEDLKFFEARVRKAFGKVVPQHVFDAAVSFDFNTGAIHRASWVKHYLAGDMKKARTAFMQWRKPPEIIGRRTREAELLFEGKYVTKEVRQQTLKRVPVSIVGGPPDSDETDFQWTRELKFGFKGADVKRMQELLTERNYSTGGTDGNFGPLTRDAVLSWKAHNGWPTDSGNMDTYYLEELEKSGTKPVSMERANLTTKEVTAKSTTAALSDGVRKIAAASTVVVGGAEVADQTGLLQQASDIADRAEQTKSIMDRAVGIFTDVGQFISDHKVLLIVVAIMVVGFLAHKALKKEVQETRTGEIV